MENFFFNLIYLAPPEETLQDTSQGEVTKPIACRTDWLALCVSLSKLSLTQVSIFVSSSKIIFGFVCCNAESMKSWWNCSIANAPCSSFMVLTVEIDWIQSLLKSLKNGKFSTNLKESVPGLRSLLLRASIWILKKDPRNYFLRTCPAT